MRVETIQIGTCARCAFRTRHPSKYWRGLCRPPHTEQSHRSGFQASRPEACPSKSAGAPFKLPTNAHLFSRTLVVDLRMRELHGVGIETVDDVDAHTANSLVSTASAAFYVATMLMVLSWRCTTVTAGTRLFCHFGAPTAKDRVFSARNWSLSRIRLSSSSMLSASTKNTRRFSKR